jgi:UDP-N-acetylmuramoyl-L-alanyl-D-glutamate--2,6-diaminopimelate ligase
MRLKYLIGPLGPGAEASLEAGADVEVTGIAWDSRLVKKGELFAALKGEHSDGLEFVREAVKGGASSLLCGAPVKGVTVPQVVVPDVRVALSKIAARFFGEPSKRIKLVGITGTNGKTTTVYLVESILKAAGFETGAIGTINYRYGAEALPALLTTPEAPELQRILGVMAASGVTHCVMEVSSHALAMKRVEGCGFEVKVFTNLTRDHLDFHHTMEEYFNAKARFFTDEAFGTGPGVSIINVDSEWGEALACRIDGSLKYSIVCDRKSSDICPESFSISSDGIEAAISTPVGTVEVSSPLVGEFNLYNIMAAAAVGSSLGIGADLIAKGLNSLAGVPGRLERVCITGGPVGTKAPRVFVDYAHTPDALGSAIGALMDTATRPGPASRVITVFGCGGNRDRSKRPLMGEITRKLSNVTILTSDNPRDEDPIEIIKEIEAGMGGLKKYGPDELVQGDGYVVIPDREEALRKAIGLAREDDTILVAGKGHEDYQIVKGERKPFDDRDIVKALLERAAKRRGVA